MRSRVEQMCWYRYGILRWRWRHTSPGLGYRCQTDLLLRRLR